MKILKLIIPLFIIVILTFGYFFTISSFKEQFFVGKTANLVFYDSDNRPFYTSSNDQGGRSYTGIKNISRPLLMSVVAIEDARFFQHIGFDIPRIMKIIQYLVTNQPVYFGASTITQQLVKNTLLTPERTLKRKLLELIAAIFIEIKYTKAQILEMYLNSIFFGNNSYGIAAATQNYFAKNPSDINLAESAMIAGIIKKPEGYSPLNDVEIARQRQLIVLERLLRLGWIDSNEYSNAVKMPIKIMASRQSSRKAPYFVAGLINILEAKYGKDLIHKKGLRVYTTLDWQKQNALEKTVNNHLASQSSDQQVAALTIENGTGKIRALIGGRSFDESQFNRALQSLRSPGSAVKPFIYALAFDKGWLPTDTLVDSPVSYFGDQFNFDDAAGFYDFYEPQNFNQDHVGEASLAYGLVYSNNVMSVKLLNEIGVSDYVDFVKLFGLNFDKQKGLCLALGCDGVSLLKLTNAYLAFANVGVFCEAKFYNLITYLDGTLLEDITNHDNCRRIIDPDSAYMVKYLLNQVIEAGTGKNAKISRFAGGKTGTSDGFRDAWFVGFTDSYTTGIWLGNDDNSPMEGETGGREPATIWREYTNNITEINNLSGFENLPAGNWQTVDICLFNGKRYIGGRQPKIGVKLKIEDVPVESCIVQNY